VTATASSRIERCLPWVAVAAGGWLALFPITSVDAYYHVAVGKRILETRSIPNRGVGSASFGQQPWHDNEWGFQAIAAVIGTTAHDDSGVVVLTPSGRAGLILFRAAACALTLTFLLLTMQVLGVPALATALGVWLAAFLTFGNLFWDIRPQILSFAALAACGWLLEKDREGARWALPAVLGAIALWSNVHGAFVLGIALVGGEAAGAWLELSRARAIRMTATLALAPVAACVNPLGWHQLAHPFLYLFRPEIFAGNNEWTPPDLRHLPLLVLFTLVVFGAVVAGARPRAGHVFRILVFAVLFATAIRHLPALVIAGVPPGLALLRQAPKLRLPSAARARSLAAAALAAGIVALSGSKFIGLVPRFEESPSRPLAEAHVRWLARHGFDGPGFNDYRFGGFLMLRRYPQEIVLMDGRNDLYGTFRTGPYNDVLYSRPGWDSTWDEMQRRWNLRWVLVDAATPFAGILERDAAWRRVREERVELEPSIALYVSN
jgi:hypothetical protein